MSQEACTQLAWILTVFRVCPRTPSRGPTLNRCLSGMSMLRTMQHQIVQLSALESEGSHIVCEAMTEVEHPVLLSSGSEDSAIVLWLAMKASRTSKFMSPRRPRFVSSGIQMVPMGEFGLINSRKTQGSHLSSSCQNRRMPHIALKGCRPQGAPR